MTGRGKFITVEGIEGVGKSTNLAFVVSLLEERGRSVLTTREPGGTPLAERIRGLLLSHDDEPLSDTAELLLFFAARSLHIENLIRPALERGEWVVCDRFTDTTRAYQGAARAQGLARVETLAEWVENGVSPDLTILLDAPAHLGMERARQRGAVDRLESEQLEFFERARDAYLDLASRESDRIIVVDASRELAAVQGEIAAAVTSLFADK